LPAGWGWQTGGVKQKKHPQKKGKSIALFDAYRWLSP
jgi:hypothetical protein